MNSASTAPAAIPVVRVPAFDIPDRIDTGWQPAFPEFAAAANSVSLLMPHVEPYVARTVRAAVEALGPDVVPAASAFVAQELQHQAQHRRVNAALVRATPALARVERWAGRTYGWMERHASLRWSVAFAAGFETSAYALARWSDRHLGDLFRGARSDVPALFLWHLAEEVEHKSVAFDVQRALDGSRLRHLAAGAASLLLLAWFTVIGTLVQLVASGRWWSPVVWFRLTRWSWSLAFEVLPDLAVSATARHHPDDVADPAGLVAWLRAFDPSTGRDPLRRS